jgi:hypothetical protein
VPSLSRQPPWTPLSPKVDIGGRLSLYRLIISHGFASYTVNSMPGTIILSPSHLSGFLPMVYGAIMLSNAILHYL